MAPCKNCCLLYSSRLRYTLPEVKRGNFPNLISQPRPRRALLLGTTNEAKSWATVANSAVLLPPETILPMATLKTQKSKVKYLYFGL